MRLSKTLAYNLYNLASIWMRYMGNTRNAILTTQLRALKQAVRLGQRTNDETYVAGNPCKMFTRSTCIEYSRNSRNLDSLTN